jgi:hydrogenase nickel incorporation protein HypA/HybF
MLTCGKTEPMHEMMVAQNVLAAMLDEASRQNAKPTTAKISCGKLNVINDEALRFAFDAIAKGTPCEGVELEIEHKPIKAHCKNCNEDFDVEDSDLKCPKCGGDDYELLPDAPLLLEEIDFQ